MVPDPGQKSQIPEFGLGGNAMQIKNNEMNILVEALPYLSAFKGKTVVVKYGGNAMLNDDLKNKVLEDIVFLRFAGMRPVGLSMIQS